MVKKIAKIQDCRSVFVQRGAENGVLITQLITPMFDRGCISQEALGRARWSRGVVPGSGSLPITTLVLPLSFYPSLSSLSPLAALPLGFTLTAPACTHGSGYDFSRYSFRATFREITHNYVKTGSHQGKDRTRITYSGFGYPRNLLPRYTIRGLGYITEPHAVQVQDP